MNSKTKLIKTKKKRIGAKISRKRREKVKMNEEEEKNANDHVV
jgi:hypothetical protein